MIFDAPHEVWKHHGFIHFYPNLIPGPLWDSKIWLDLPTWLTGISQLERKKDGMKGMKLKEWVLFLHEIPKWLGEHFRYLTCVFVGDVLRIVPIFKPTIKSTTIWENMFQRKSQRIGA